MFFKELVGYTIGSIDVLKSNNKGFQGQMQN